jgi:jumonji domain-containing protein 2
MVAFFIMCQFWKNIAFSPPLYGADILNTLMDEKSKGWNLNSLDSILMDALSDKVKGVNTPYCYVGSWKALFCWHTEDLDLSAINFLHYGKPKFWYAVHQDDRHIL